MRKLLYLVYFTLDSSKLAKEIVAVLLQSLLHAADAAPPYHEVTVTTDPPEGPFPPWFHCDTPV